MLEYKIYLQKQYDELIETFLDKIHDAMDKNLIDFNTFINLIDKVNKLQGVYFKTAIFYENAIKTLKEYLIDLDNQINDTYLGKQEKAHQNLSLILSEAPVLSQIIHVYITSGDERLTAEYLQCFKVNRSFEEYVVDALRYYYDICPKYIEEQRYKIIAELGRLNFSEPENLFDRATSYCNTDFGFKQISFNK